VQDNTLRRIDYWIGQPLCLLLTLLRRLVDLFRRDNVGKTKLRRLLFFKLVEQGATVLAYSAIQRAVERVGRDNVYFCVFEQNRPILDLLDVVPRHNVVVIRQSGLVLCLLDMMRALFRVRQLDVDAIIDMEGFSRASAIFAYLSGAHCRVGHHGFGMDTPYRGDLMTHRVQYNPHLHCAAAFESLVLALDETPGNIPLGRFPADQLRVARARFKPSEEEIKEIQELLGRLLPVRTSGPLVILNPNAGDLLPIRKWPYERYAQLAQSILARHSDVTLLVTGAPSEREFADITCRAIGSPRAISLAGQTSLRDLVVLFSLCDVLVSNDSGPAHFASLTDIETVVLFGPETPLLSLVPPAPRPPP